MKNPNRYTLRQINLNETMKHTMEIVRRSQNQQHTHRKYKTQKRKDELNTEEEEK